MANKKISELDLATSLTAISSAHIPIVVGGVTKKYESKGLWYSSSGTGGSDGNGGQPPQAKGTAGSLALNDNNAHAAFTFATGAGSDGLYIFGAWIPGGNQLYSTSAIVTVDNNTAKVFETGDTGAYIRPTGDGTNTILLTKNTIGNQTVTTILTKIGGVPA